MASIFRKAHKTTPDAKPRDSMVAKPPKSILRTQRRDKAAPRPSKSWLASLLPSSFGGDRISFRRRVEVAEYARCLSRDTVPGDGTIVTMGLGRLLRRTSAALARVPPPGKAPLEESAWLPGAERVRLLRRSMGDKRFFGAWVHSRRTTIRVLAERSQSRKNIFDQVPMASSQYEAKMRADILATEAAFVAAEHNVGRWDNTYTSPLKRSSGCDTRCPSSARLRSAHKRRRTSDRQCRAWSAYKPGLGQITPVTDTSSVDELLQIATAVKWLRHA